MTKAEIDNYAELNDSPLRIYPEEIKKLIAHIREQDETLRGYDRQVDELMIKVREQDARMMHNTPKK